jgi:hypothetical protein
LDLDFVAWSPASLIVNCSQMGDLDPKRRKLFVAGYALSGHFRRPYTGSAHYLVPVLVEAYSGLHKAVMHCVIYQDANSFLLQGEAVARSSFAVDSFAWYFDN